MTAPRKRPGPAPKPAAEVRRQRGVKFSDIEWAEVQRRAAEAGQPANVWLRERALGE